MAMRVRFLLIAVLFGVSLPAFAADESFEGRDIIMTLPQKLPPVGSRALLVVLHGGGGNASFMQSHFDMSDTATKDGFVVAYLSGTPAARVLSKRMLAWNSGNGCCGKPADDNVDDVGYITGAVAYLSNKYGIDPKRTYVTGHSNGAMMAQLMLCTTNVFAAGVTMSGPVNGAVTECPAAKGKRILAIHGALDENVPIAGGVGTKGPQKAKNIPYRSEASAKALFEQSGASYTIEVVPGVDHSLEHQADAIKSAQGVSLEDKIAKFLGLEAN